MIRYGDRPYTAQLMAEVLSDTVQAVERHTLWPDLLNDRPRSSTIGRTENFWPKHFSAEIVFSRKIFRPNIFGTDIFLAETTFVRNMFGPFFSAKIVFGQFCFSVDTFFG